MCVSQGQCPHALAASSHRRVSEKAGRAAGPWVFQQFSLRVSSLAMATTVLTSRVRPNSVPSARHLGRSPAVARLPHISGAAWLCPLLPEGSRP